MQTEPAPVLAVKLGGSLITDKCRDRTDRPEVLARLSCELAESLSREGAPQVILGHGSGSFGHVAASQAGIDSGVTNAQHVAGVAETQAAAAALHRKVLAALSAAGLAPFSIAPSSAMVAEGGRPTSFDPEPMALALRLGLLPVTYGDVVLDRRQGAAICSTESVLIELARSLPGTGLAIHRALWLGETPGVLDTAGRPLAELRRGDDALAAIGGAAGTDVTGGMRHRVDAALSLAELGVESWVLDGTVPGLLASAVAGDPVPGTRIPAASG